jgi:hypothetical protein
MRSPLAALGLPLLAAAVACGDASDVDFGGRDIGPDLFSIVSTDGAVRMALTDDYVYLTLSDDKREEVRQSLRSEADAEGAAGRVSGWVERTVGRALDFRDLHPVDEIEDIRWEDGRVRFDFKTRRRQPSIQVGDEETAGTFDEASAREFREELHALKREQARSRRGG